MLKRVLLTVRTTLALLLGSPTISEDGGIAEHAPGDSILMQNAKVFGPPETVSEDINHQVAEMVNFLFGNGMREDDYKVICEDDIIKRPNNCHARSPVECNPEVLEALKGEAKKTDFRLKEVNKDILKAATIITKSLLVLDKVAQDEGHPVVAHEMGMINGALALLGNANYRNNLVRRFILKRELNHKYAHLCSDKVPMTRFLLGDDVSHSARQIEESEILKYKISTKKPPATWRFTGRRARGYWGKTSHRGFSRFQPFGQQRYGYRGVQRQSSTRHDTDSKNARSQGHSKPQQQ